MDGLGAGEAGVGAVREGGETDLERERNPRRAINGFLEVVAGDMGEGGTREAAAWSLGEGVIGVGSLTMAHVYPSPERSCLQSRMEGVTALGVSAKEMNDAEGMPAVKSPATEGRRASLECEVRRDRCAVPVGE